jgi:GNAT superfamily N-acetyltransferase
MARPSSAMTLTSRQALPNSSTMGTRLLTDPDSAHEDATRERLIAHNVAASEAVRRRFEPQHLKAEPVAAYAVDDGGELLGGCVGRIEALWQWLTIDLMWVRDDQRGNGLGRELLTAVEEQARQRGCRWAKLNTWEFQAPDFYSRCGYEVYAREQDYPPGHVNHLMRKSL